jgi:hypothetical protein
MEVQQRSVGDLLEELPLLSLLSLLDFSSPAPSSLLFLLLLQRSASGTLILTTYTRFATARQVH